MEGTKTLQDVLAPVDGEVVGVNSALTKQASLITADPEGQGWLVEIKMSDPRQLDSLLDSDPAVQKRDNFRTGQTWPAPRPSGRWTMRAPIRRTVTGESIPDRHLRRSAILLGRERTKDRRGRWNSVDQTPNRPNKSPRRSMRNNSASTPTQRHDYAPSTCLHLFRFRSYGKAIRGHNHRHRGCRI